MKLVRRFLAAVFTLCLTAALLQCGRRGSPSGGPRDETPPVLVRAEPEDRSLNFNSQRIRLYFDEFIRLEKVQEQLIVSPPLKYPPEISPMGGARRYVEIIIKDTLLEHTTYTFNFGQSVVDNNEGNPYNNLTYVFSTGDYLDSLSITGAVADGYNRSPDNFISVMLYEIDSVYTDSLVYRKPPYYMTNTLDSALIWRMENLKAGRYRLIAVKDEGKNNVFDPGADKIGFVEDTIVLPTDSTYVLRMFREIPKYAARTPSFAAANKILFGFTGGEAPGVELLTPLPDSVRTLLARLPGQDSLAFWFTPMQADSLIFTLQHPRDSQQIDTFSVKPLKVAADSLRLSWSSRRELIPGDSIFLESNLPLAAIDTALYRMTDQDTLPVPLRVALDTAKNRVLLDFEKRAEQSYFLEMLPGALTDFFGDSNDTLITRWGVGSPADYGVLKLNLDGGVAFPVVVELTDDEGRTLRRQALATNEPVEFPWLTPDTYRVRVVLDANGNGKWDTGNFLQKLQPERVIYYPAPIEMRANWEKVETFTILE